MAATKKVDTAYDRRIYLNGRLFGGIQSCNIKYDVLGTHTEVTLRMVVRPEGITIKGRDVLIESINSKNILGE